MNKDKERTCHSEGSIESLGSKEAGYLLDPFLAFDYLNLLKYATGEYYFMALRDL